MLRDEGPAPPTGDAHIQQLHELALRGDEDARSAVLKWVYYEAEEYYMAKASQRDGISKYEAQELTSQFVLSFVKSWQHVRDVARYTRAAIKQNLVRYLATRRTDTVSLEDLDATNLLAVSEEMQTESWMTWSDETLSLYSVISLEYHSMTEETVTLIEARLQEPEVPYSEICGRLGLSVGAARMRVHRFFERVRNSVDFYADGRSGYEGELP